MYGECKRRPIANSFSPENHVLHVWDSLVAPTASFDSVYLLTHGNGSSLAVDIVISERHHKRPILLNSDATSR